MITWSYNKSVYSNNQDEVRISTEHLNFTTRAKNKLLVQLLDCITVCLWNNRLLTTAGITLCDFASFFSNEFLRFSRLCSCHPRTGLERIQFITKYWVISWIQITLPSRVTGPDNSCVMYPSDVWFVQIRVHSSLDWGSWMVVINYYAINYKNPMVLWITLLSNCQSLFGSLQSFIDTINWRTYT